jgi:hypothetical protein
MNAIVMNSSDFVNILRGFHCTVPVITTITTETVVGVL